MPYQTLVSNSLEFSRYTELNPEVPTSYQEHQTIIQSHFTKQTSSIEMGFSFFSFSLFIVAGSSRRSVLFPTKITGTGRFSSVQLS